MGKSPPIIFDLLIFDFRFKCSNYEDKYPRKFSETTVGSIYCRIGFILHSVDYNIMYGFWSVSFLLIKQIKISLADARDIIS